MEGPVFQLFSVDEELPPEFRLATVLDVQTNREALLEAMPNWEIANLADGSVDGRLYNGKIRLVTRKDVGHKLATLKARGMPGPRGGNEMIINLINKGN